jgi:hypothetical protein
MYPCFPGFEHYDVVHLATGTFGIKTEKRAAILSALRESSLHRAYTQDDTGAFRRLALELVGIAVGADPPDGASSLGDDADDDASIASTTSSRASSRSSHAPDAPPTALVRRSNDKNKFCSSFNDASKHDDRQPTTDADLRSEASTEDFSDISDDSDIFHLTVDPSKSWCTEQDMDYDRIAYIATLLRDNPFVPPDPNDPTATKDFTDVQSGIALPRAHCAFRGCGFTNDGKDLSL